MAFFLFAPMPRLLVVILLALHCCAGAAAAADRPHLSSDPRVKSARALVKSGRFHQALTVLRPLVPDHPDQTDVRFLHRPGRHRRLLAGRPTEREAVALPEGVPYTIRFQSPGNGATVVDDKVKGRVEFDNTELDDLILARSDGSPTYNFCVVCDDIDMGITHIIRGDDHLSNTPRQMQLYQALGSAPPVFAHVPLILGTDKQRLSKRHGANSVMAYRDMGYFPEALNNYLVRLGWSHGDQEIFHARELVEKFDIDAVGKSSAVFNPEKLLWLNAHYLKNRPLSRLAEDVVPYLAAKGYAVPDDRPWLEKMVETLSERAESLVELVDMARYFLEETVEIDDKAGRKHLVPEARNLLQEVAARLENLGDFNQAGIEQVFADIVAERDIKLGKVAQPVRVALTGFTVSPGIYEVVGALGQEVTLERLAAGLRYIDR